ncbi:MAG: hypothetical protein DRQ47_10410, partial [Gammaproteobacteria bacterium]
YAVRVNKTPADVHKEILGLKEGDSPSIQTYLSNAKKAFIEGDPAAAQKQVDGLTQWAVTQKNKIAAYQSAVGKPAGFDFSYKTANGVERKLSVFPTTPDLQKQVDKFAAELKIINASANKINSQLKQRKGRQANKKKLLNKLKSIASNVRNGTYSGKQVKAINSLILKLADLGIAVGVIAKAAGKKVTEVEEYLAKNEKPFHVPPARPVEDDEETEEGARPKVTVTRPGDKQEPAKKSARPKVDVTRPGQKTEATPTKTARPKVDVKRPGTSDTEEKADTNEIGLIVGSDIVIRINDGRAIPEQRVDLDGNFSVEEVVIEFGDAILEIETLLEKGKRKKLTRNSLIQSNVLKSTDIPTNTELLQAFDEGKVRPILETILEVLNRNQPTPTDTTAAEPQVVEEKEEQLPTSLGQEYSDLLDELASIEDIEGTPEYDANKEANDKRAKEIYARTEELDALGIDPAPVEQTPKRAKIETTRPALKTEAELEEDTIAAAPVENDRIVEPTEAEDSAELESADGIAEDEELNGITHETEEAFAGNPDQVTVDSVSEELRAKARRDFEEGEKETYTEFDRARDLVEAMAGINDPVVLAAREVLQEELNQEKPDINDVLTEAEKVMGEYNVIPAEEGYPELEARAKKEAKNKFDGKPSSKAALNFHSIIRTLAQAAYTNADAVTARLALFEDLDVIQKEYADTQKIPAISDFYFRYGQASPAKSILRNGIVKQLNSDNVWHAEDWIGVASKQKGPMGIFANFFQQIANIGVMSDIKSQYGLTTQEAKFVLKIGSKFMPIFNTAIQKDYVIGDSLKFGTQRKESWQNLPFDDSPLKLLRDENGELDPNVYGAMGIAALAWFTTNQNDLIYKNSEDMNKLIGRDKKQKITPEAFHLLSRVGVS